MQPLSRAPSRPNPLTWPIRALSSSMFLLFTAGMVLGGGLCQLLALPWDPERRVSAAFYRFFWGRLLFALHPTLDRQLRGMEHVGPGPYIVVSNHTSSLDIPSAYVLPLPLRVVIRHQHFQLPGVGAWLRFTRQVRLERDDPDGVQQGIDAALASLRAGISLLVFPEGTRSPDGELHRFRRGAFRLSMDTGVPVLPIVQEGFGPVYPRGFLVQHRLRGRIRFTVLPPVSPAGFRTARALSRRVEAMMREVIEAGDPP